MPLRAQHERPYPIGEPDEVSVKASFERARGRCEVCGREHDAKIIHLSDGRWLDTESGIWRDERGKPLSRLIRAECSCHIVKLNKIVLTIAYRDHDPTNKRPENLKWLCQRCLMLHNHPEHKRHRWLRFHMQKASGDLFLGPYPL